MASINDLGEIRDEVLVRLGSGTTIAYYTDTIIKNWINQSHKWAGSQHRWPFTEGKETTTYSSSTEEYDYPEDWRSDSIRLLQVGGKRLDKINFNDYQAYIEDTTSGTDRIYSDFARRYFINVNSDVSGTITVWGQFTPADMDITDESLTTVFSGNEEEGNDAIIEQVLSYAMLKEKKPQEAQLHHKRAQEILETVWERYKSEQFGYLTKNRGLFKRLDVLFGTERDEIRKEDQWF